VLERVFGKKSSHLIYQAALSGVLLCAFAFPSLVQAKRPVVLDELAVVTTAELPPQGRDTFEKIHQGGPFAYEKDGVVFGNRERILPNEKRGYYREYTVKTPGASNRGTRRIICGGQPKTPDVCYYTADHYASFRKIKP
jgi:ribonuclease T1